MTSLGQRTLFGHETPAIDPCFRDAVRTELAEGAWVDVVKGWLHGHAQLFDVLIHGIHWRADERAMYERVVDVPRLHATIANGARVAPILVTMREALDARYATSFDRLSAALYRDGRDSVAWHGDYVARRMPEALVATISLGSPRKFLLRPTGGGKSIAFSLGFGDLIVMGGSCQRTWQHAIPKVAGPVGPRIAVMCRPTWRDDGADRGPRHDR